MRGECEGRGRKRCGEAERSGSKQSVGGGVRVKVVLVHVRSEGVWDESE